MPLTSSEPPLALRDQAQFWIYRVSAYLLINLIDDPAWLALMFCQT